jgi:hypothetical protein
MSEINGTKHELEKELNALNCKICSGSEIQKYLGHMSSNSRKMPEFLLQLFLPGMSSLQIETPKVMVDD